MSASNHPSRRQTLGSVQTPHASLKSPIADRWAGVAMRALDAEDMRPDAAGAEIALEVVLAELVREVTRAHRDSVVLGDHIRADAYGNVLMLLLGGNSLS